MQRWSSPRSRKKIPTTGEPPTLDGQANGWSKRMEAEYTNAHPAAVRSRRRRRRPQPNVHTATARSFFRNRYQGDLSRILSCRSSWMRKQQKKHIKDSAKRSRCFQDPSKATRRSRRSQESMFLSGCSAARQREPSIIMDRGSGNGRISSTNTYRQTIIWYPGKAA